VGNSLCVVQFLPQGPPRVALCRGGTSIAIQHDNTTDKKEALMTVADRITDGKLVPLPAEAGDVNAPRFEPNTEWLRGAAPHLQKLAMWRWFATRYADPAGLVPPDDEGGYQFAKGGPCLADRILLERFEAQVPPEVIDDLVHQVQAEVGNEWAPKRADGFGG
jgi:hypothetical protein